MDTNKRERGDRITADARRFTQIKFTEDHKGHKGRSLRINVLFFVAFEASL
jgi:hypothetical protein